MFLGYLVLLLNFGESLHHAPIFGLHVHQHTDETIVEDSSCCCHSHAHPQPLTPTEQDTPDVALDEQLTTAQHDCAFCKFFDQFNVPLYGQAATLAEAPANSLDVEPAAISITKIVSRTARGPPLC